MDTIKLEQLMSLFPDYTNVRVYNSDGDNLGTFDKNDKIDTKYANSVVKKADANWDMRIIDVLVEVPDYSERMFRFNCPFAGNWNAGDVVPVKPLDNGQVLVDGVAQITQSALESVGEFIPNN